MRLIFFYRSVPMRIIECARVHASSACQQHCCCCLLLRDVPFFCTSRDVVVVTRCCCCVAGRVCLLLHDGWMLWTVCYSPTRNSHLDGNQGTVLCGYTCWNFIPAACAVDANTSKRGITYHTQYDIRHTYGVQRKSQARTAIVRAPRPAKDSLTTSIIYSLQ